MKTANAAAKITEFEHKKKSTWQEKKHELQIVNKKTSDENSTVLDAELFTNHVRVLHLERNVEHVEASTTSAEHAERTRNRIGKISSTPRVKTDPNRMRVNQVVKKSVFKVYLQAERTRYSLISRNKEDF